MSSATKGRWVALAIVVIVTTAWSIATSRIEWDCAPLPSALFVFGGLYVGLPYGWIAGTMVGRLAGRLERTRGLIIVTAIAWTLLADLVVAAFARRAPCAAELPAAPLFVLSLVPTIAGAVALERWTRPAERLARARVV